VVPLEIVGENLVVNFKEKQFQAQDASINLLRKCSQLVYFWTRNLLEGAMCLPEKNYQRRVKRIEETFWKFLICNLFGSDKQYKEFVCMQGQHFQHMHTCILILLFLWSDS
jgi:hypothetical protein